jgi:hypothetical protein
LILAGAPTVGFWAFFIVPVAGVALDYVYARRINAADDALIMRFLAPRTYRGPRRLVLLAIAAAIPTNVFTTPQPAPQLGTVIVLLALAYTVDRVIPVVDTPGTRAAPGGGTSPWLRRLGLLWVAGALALVFLAELPTIISRNVDAKVARVRAGDRLDYGLLNVLAFAEPRADPVDVRWLGTKPPPPFDAGPVVRLTFFGQNAGTSIFLDARPLRDAVYHLPTAAITIAAPAR